MQSKAMQREEKVRRVMQSKVMRSKVMQGEEEVRRERRRGEEHA